MFHESGEESLEQGHVGVEILGLGGCGISSVVLLPPTPPLLAGHGVDTEELSETIRSQATP